MYGDGNDRCDSGGASTGLSLHPVNRALLDYWLTKRDGDGAPLKSVIDPTEIPRLLPDLVIYERIEPDHFRVRVIGTRVTARLGVDPTGGNIFELFAERFKANVMQAMNRILDEPCAQVTTVRDRFPSGYEVRVEVLRLPLCDGQRHPRFIISSTAELKPRGRDGGGEAPQTLAEPLDNRFFPLNGDLSFPA